MKMYAVGDEVKLTDRFAATLMRRPTNKLNWAARRGVVNNINRIHVFVTWSGNRSAEQLPLAAVEMST